MVVTRPVADLATGLGHARGLLEADEPARLAVPGHVAAVALGQFGLGQIAHHNLDGIAGMGLFREFLVVAVFLLVTLAARLGTDIPAGITSITVSAQAAETTRAASENAQQPLIQNDLLNMNQPP